MARLDMESAALPTDDDQEFLTGRQRASGSWRKGALASALALGLGAACFAAGRRSLQSAPASGAVTDLVTEVETFGAKMSGCASLTENCFSNKCCQSSGYQCFETGANTAKCALTCPPGSKCSVLSPSFTTKPTWNAGDSMYCYTVLVVERGPALLDNPKELAILKHQKSQGLGVFGCDASSVFSDKPIDFGGSSTVVQPTADWKNFMRKDKPGRYLNTPLFMGVWKQIKAENKYPSFAWTVKADVPTVFLPALLKSRLGDYPETPTGTYIDTCNKVLMGYFGNLEVTSKTGMKRFLEQFESYYVNGGKCWKWDTEECKKKWQYGAWGEDLFMQFCMDDAEVAKKDDFTLTNTGTCPGMRPKSDKKNTDFVPDCTNQGVYKFAAVHPLRNVSAWSACYDAFSART